MVTGKIKINLGHALVKTGKITADQCEHAINECKETGKRIKDILVTRGYINEKQLERLFSRTLNLPAISLHGIGINPKVKALIPREIARKHLTIPVFVNGNVLAVATDDPLDFDSLNQIAHFTQKDILTTFSCSNDIMTMLNKYEELF